GEVLLGCRHRDADRRDSVELHQVRYFVTLCKTLNFTRAAEVCNVTQPALTRAIQRLEDELGGSLFQRERSLTQLTELGRLMRPLLEQAIAAAEAAKENATRFRRSELATLRIGLPPTISAGIITAPLREIFPANPRLGNRAEDGRAGSIGGSPAARRGRCCIARRQHRV